MVKFQNNVDENDDYSDDNDDGLSIILMTGTECKPPPAHLSTPTSLLHCNALNINAAVPIYIVLQMVPIIFYFYHHHHHHHDDGGCNQSQL